MLDLNVYKKELEKQNSSYETQLMDFANQNSELKSLQRAAEIQFNQQLQVIQAEFLQKEEIMMKVIMEGESGASGERDVREYLLKNKENEQSEKKLSAKQQLERQKEQQVASTKFSLTKRINELEKHTRDADKQVDYFK